MTHIFIGVTGWGDHEQLYPAGTRPSEKLSLYAGHFPLVEVDASFYALQPQRNFASWAKQTPDNFQFVVKAHQRMTGHQRGDDLKGKRAKDVFTEFRDSLSPLREAGKLATVLFQFPPWVDCQKKYVAYIRQCRDFFNDLPLAVEFRHQSWFSPRYKEATLNFLRQEQLVHVVCDEPQVGSGCVPIVPVVTHAEKVLVRFHGRNRAGWVNRGQDNWRAVRYNYRYNERELREWADRLRALAEQAAHVYVLFNNNSKGDAVPNAREMIDLLGIRYRGLAPRQLEWF
ncbi:DUF72 domain-containing protein [Numidum massiliense]|uniref:DUF72 domain-containing protein n=1 Tax=Numidum massiliense TaxID=1522315 RepID=UPI000A46F39E|nr:DUF72 domain-containing protein [Numidum massiliense]